jgi:hypothetical protein
MSGKEKVQDGVDVLREIKAVINRPEVTQASGKKEEDGDGFADDEDGADEDNGPPKCGKQRVTCNNGPKSRDPEKNALQESNISVICFYDSLSQQAAIRAHTMKLMKCTRNNAPLPPPPSQDELRWLIVEEDNAGPSISNFTLDYLGEPMSKWNLVAVDLFVQDFIETKWSSFSPKDDLEDARDDFETQIRTAFRTHLLTLKKKYKKSLQFAEDELAEAESHSCSARDRRRLTVSLIVLLLISSDTQYILALLLSPACV